MEGFDGTWREAFALGRHLQRGIGAGDAVKEVGLIGFSGDDGGTIIAALEGGCARIEAQVSFLFFFSMTLDAVRLEEGPNGFVEGVGGCAEDEGEAGDEEEWEGGAHGGLWVQRGDADVYW